MEEQLNITLNIYKEEKNKIISKINEFKGDFEEKQIKEFMIGIK